MRKLRHAEIQRPTPSEVRQLRRHPVKVLLNNVRSLYNVGSIFRTADGALVEEIILTGITGTPANPDMQKTALGAQDTVPWRYAEDPIDLIDNLRKEGCTIAALELTDTPRNFRELTVDNFPLCLIMGHEVFGIDESLLDRCDFALEIPQYGAKQSLNVAVACGIAVYGAVGRYRELTGKVSGV